MYVPNNVYIYTWAFSGALAGMAASQRVIVDPTSADYLPYCQQAGQWAQELDTVYGDIVGASATWLDVQNAEQLSYGQFDGRGTVTNTNAPANYVVQATAVVALMVEADAYFVSQGIVPPSPSGGAGGSNGFLLQPGGVAGNGVYITVPTLMAAVGMVPNGIEKDIGIDTSLGAVNWPAGTSNVNNCNIHAGGNTPVALITFLPGARWAWVNLTTTDLELVCTDGGSSVSLFTGTEVGSWQAHTTLVTNSGGAGFADVEDTAILTAVGYGLVLASTEVLSGGGVGTAIDLFLFSGSSLITDGVSTAGSLNVQCDSSSSVVASQGGTGTKTFLVINPILAAADDLAAGATLNVDGAAGCFGNPNVANCATSGAAVTVNMPAVPYQGMPVLVKNVGAAVVAPTLVNATGGWKIEEAQNPGVFSGANGQSVQAGQGQSVLYQADVANTRWVAIGGWQ